MDSKNFYTFQDYLFSIRGEPDQKGQFAKDCFVDPEWNGKQLQLRKLLQSRNDESGLDIFFDVQSSYKRQKEKEKKRKIISLEKKQ